MVRIKKGGKRFEIACYRNKVVSWRNEVEKDIDEVLQTHSIFTNVSKGQVAKKEDLVKAFGKHDETEICKEILTKGELQVSDKERQSSLDSVFKEIATIVADKCINPEIERPYPVATIESAMKDAHYSIKPNQNAKQQALAVIKLLKETIPIARAQMKVRVLFQGKDTKKSKEKLLKFSSVALDSEERSGEHLIITFLVDPGEYREVESFVKAETKRNDSLEIVSFKEIPVAQEIF